MNNPFYAFVVIAEVLKHALVMIKKRFALRDNFNIHYLKRSRPNHITNTVTLTSPVISDVQSNKQPNELFRFCWRGAFFFLGNWRRRGGSKFSVRVGDFP